MNSFYVGCAPITRFGVRSFLTILGLGVIGICPTFWILFNKAQVHHLSGRQLVLLTAHPKSPHVAVALGLGGQSGVRQRGIR